MMKKIFVVAMLAGLVFALALPTLAFPPPGSKTDDHPWGGDQAQPVCTQQVAPQPPSSGLQPSLAPPHKGSDNAFGNDNARPVLAPPHKGTEDPWDFDRARPVLAPPHKGTDPFGFDDLWARICAWFNAP